jgi:hypothetical protein
MPFMALLQTLVQMVLQYSSQIPTIKNDFGLLKLQSARKENGLLSNSQRILDNSLAKQVNQTDRTSSGQSGCLDG